MSTAQQESEVVSGTINGIIQKGPDRWQVAVIPTGSQYAKNLWTKDAGLVNQLSQMIGQQQGFNCGVSHWNMNDGTPVRSLWINGVGQPQPQPQQWGQAQAAPQPSPGFTTTAQVMQQPNVVPQAPVPVQRLETPDEKRTSIHRQTASKVAAWLIQADPEMPRDFGTFLALCERLIAYYEHGSAAEAENVPFGNDGEPPRHPLDDPFPPGY